MCYIYANIAHLVRSIYVTTRVTVGHIMKGPRSLTMYTKAYCSAKVVIAFALLFSFVGFISVKFAPGSKSHQSSSKDPSFIVNNEVPRQFQDILRGMSASIEYSHDNG